MAVRVLLFNGVSIVLLQVSGKVTVVIAVPLVLALICTAAAPLALYIFEQKAPTKWQPRALSKRLLSFGSQKPGGKLLAIELFA